MPGMLDGSDILAPVSKVATLGRYVPQNLVPIPSFLTLRKIYLRDDVLPPLVKMCCHARADNISLLVLSAYRSYDYQRHLFERQTERYGSEAEANRFSARPGQSEHQLGTAMDFGGTDHDWTPEFVHTRPGQWLLRHAPEHGFVMSYPRGAEEVTGYAFEPWHYRYIGVDEAAGWLTSGLVPGEYLRRRALREE
ncbi:MAG: M15 family metallopeptidase [Firmicutes bacterium]|nr:M15 family metallopeptidase [Bacillota bacterium]